MPRSDSAGWGFEPRWLLTILVSVPLVGMDLPIIGIWIGCSYIGFIVVSCLLVKQHAIADTIAGPAIFYLNRMLKTWQPRAGN